MGGIYSYIAERLFKLYNSVMRGLTNERSSANYGFFFVVLGLEFFFSVSSVQREGQFS